MKPLLLIPFFILFLLPTQAQDKEINWMTWGEVLEAMQVEARPVVVDVYTQWCSWCKRMDASTYSDSNVVEYINKNYYAIRFDAEQKDPIEFGDTTFVYRQVGTRKGRHELASVIMQGSNTFPTTVFFGRDLGIKQAVPGYRGPKDFLMIASYLGDAQKRTVPWATYQQTFKIGDEG